MGRRTAWLGMILGIGLATVPAQAHDVPSSRSWAAVAASADDSSPTDPLDVYVASWCGYCRALESDLRSRRIPFFAHDIEADARARREYDALGGEGLPLTRVGKQVVRGYDLPAILKLLDRAK